VALPVMSDGKFEGMVGRRHILQLLQGRADSNVPATPNATLPLTVPRRSIRAADLCQSIRSASTG
jgi:hypothetical protein